MSLSGLSEALIDIGIPAILVFLMIIVGTELSPLDFRRVLRYPKAVTACIAAQVLVLPLIAVLLIVTLQPDFYIALGILVLAACPGGALSNFYTFLAQADVALSVTLTAVSTLLSLVTLPLIIALGLTWLLDSAAPQQLPLLPTTSKLLVLMLLPIGIGMLLRYHWHYKIVRYRASLRLISTLSVIALVGLLIYDHAAMLATAAFSVVSIALLFVGLTLVIGWLAGLLLRLPAEQHFALMIEFMVRNMAVAVLVVVTVLGQTEFVIFGTLFFVTEVPLILLAVAVFRHLQSLSIAKTNSARHLRTAHGHRLSKPDK